MRCVDGKEPAQDDLVITHLLLSAGLADMTRSGSACVGPAISLMPGTFYLRWLRMLRILRIGSNVAFISYGLLASAPSIVVLHALLLPINIYRPS